MIFIIVFILYTCTQFFIGRLVFRKLFDDVPILLDLIGSFLLGVFVSIPVTYVFSCIFSFTGEPLLYGMVAFLVPSSLFLVPRFKFIVSDLRKYSTKNQELRTKNEVMIVLFSLAFSTWMMGKTFHGDASGQLFVGSNNIFDFGLLVGLERSIAWGGNIPFISPFFAGLPLFYHFFFQFWISLWEYAGVSTMWAVNIPSILSFFSLLIIIYFLPQIVLQKGKLAGWIAVLLTITHSTMTFWHLIISKGMTIQFLKDMWILPTYPFAGPFDGSVISLYTTLNSFVNQRHLALGIAIGLLLYMSIAKSLEKKQLNVRRSLCIGFLTGLMFLWNMAVCLMTGIVITSLIILHKRWRVAGMFLVGFLAGVSISCIQYVPSVIHTVKMITQISSGGFGTILQVLPTWTLPYYLWENLTVLPLIMAFGFIILPNKRKVFMLPFLIFFILECLFAGVGKRGFDQKFYSFLIVGVNVMAAVGLSKLWEQRTVVFRGLSILIFFVVTISGGIDLMAVKNEFAFPFISKEMMPVISWMSRETPKNAVFVSYSDMIDPVVLAGRKNYFGFFGNIGWYDRSGDVKNIYAGDEGLAQNLGVSYVLAPKWNKNDFPYVVDTKYFREHRMIAYEDERYVIYKIND